MLCFSVVIDDSMLQSIDFDAIKLDAPREVKHEAVGRRRGKVGIQEKKSGTCDPWFVASTRASR